MVTPLRKEMRNETTAPASPTVIVGVLLALGPRGEPWVDHPYNPAGRPLTGRSTVELAPAELGREVVLVFEDGDPQRPLVLGLIRQPAADRAAERAPAPPVRSGSSPPVATLDGERVVLTAEREIVLRCGEASLTLTRAGKVLVRGRHVSSRSTGVNRILGGAVRIN